MLTGIEPGNTNKESLDHCKHTEVFIWEGRVSSETVLAGSTSVA